MSTFQFKKGYLSDDLPEKLRTERVECALVAQRRGFLKEIAI